MPLTTKRRVLPKLRPEENTPGRSQHTRQAEPSSNAGDALIEAIAQAIASKFERITATQQRLMNIEDAANFLGMTVHALRHKAGVDIPCVRIDGKLRFDKRDLDRYIDRANREGV